MLHGCAIWKYILSLNCMYETDEFCHCIEVGFHDLWSDTSSPAEHQTN